MLDNRYTRYSTEEDIMRARDHILLQDIVTGYHYAIRMINGEFTTEPICQEIKCKDQSIHIMDGAKIRPENYTFLAVYPDGSSSELNSYELRPSIDFVSTDTTEITFYYKLCGLEFDVTVPVTVDPFDPAIALIDFDYSVSNGLYTITNWKGTFNGESSTDMILPGNSYIIL